MHAVPQVLRHRSDYSYGCSSFEPTNSTGYRASPRTEYQRTRLKVSSSAASTSSKLSSRDFRAQYKAGPQSLHRPIHFVERNLVRHGNVGRQVRLVLETTSHGGGGQVELVHRR